jgi:hypothetical protein
MTGWAAKLQFEQQLSVSDTITLLNMEADMEGVSNDGDSWHGLPELLG